MEVLGRGRECVLLHHRSLNSKTRSYLFSLCADICIHDAQLKADALPCAS